MWRACCLALLAVLLRPAQAGEADVIVYGATPGGFCAAIAAAREGAKVILLEPTGHIGGLSTGGLSHCDSNQMRREALTGLFEEWHVRIAQDYVARGRPAPYDPKDKTPGIRWVFEPSVASRVTQAMLTEAGVSVVTHCRLRTVEKSGARITVLRTTQGAFTARTFVDGTYEGDLMAAAGVSWVIGRESRAEHGESLAGKQYPKPAMKVNGLDAAGGPLPLITGTDAGPDAAGDGHVMTFSFRLCLTRDPANRVPIPEPKNYDPARFELARRALQAGIRGIGFDLYPLPGNKLDGNNSIHGQVSLGLVGGSDTWHAADETERARIWEAHRQYTLEFLRFLRTDPAVPAKLRADYASLGFCQDEFVANGHFPPALYVRESRRLQGLYVLTQKDILESPRKDDAVAVSSFPIDSHDCQRVVRPDGSVMNEGTILPVRVPQTGVGYAYHVPYRALLPKPAPARKPNPSAGPKAPSTATANLTLDDPDAELSGTWTRSTTFKPHVGQGYLHDEQRADGKSRAVFRFKGPADSEFDLRMAYSAHPTRVQRLPVSVSGEGVEQRWVVDQTLALPSGDTFRNIGRLRLRQGADYVLTVANDGGPGFTILDAFELRPVPAGR
jgi:hypothetical protein